MMGLYKKILGTPQADKKLFVAERRLVLPVRRLAEFLHIFGGKFVFYFYNGTFENRESLLSGGVIKIPIRYALQVI